VASALAALWVLRVLGGRGRAPQLVRRLAAPEPVAGVAGAAEAEPLSA